MHFGIIAAGEGSRLRQEGSDLPKPLVDLNGEPMIGRLIMLMKSVGAESVSVIINDQMPEVDAYLKSLKLNVPLHILRKSTPSSLHSLYELASSGFGSDGRFVVTTVDTIFRAEEFVAYVKAFSKSNADGMMGVTRYIDDEKPLYVDVADDGHIVAFRDSVWPDAQYVSGGIYGLRESAHEILKECVTTGVMRMRNFQRALIASGLILEAYEFEKIIDVDHTTDLLKAREWLSESTSNNKLENSQPWARQR